MQNLNIAIVDDNVFDSEKLKRSVRNFFAEENPALEFEIEIFRNGEEILKIFTPEKFQIIFMDIIMKNISGIETAKKLRELDSKVMIIFTTTSAEFAFEAFPIHSFDYILKPYNSERINYVLHEAVKILESSEPYINVRVSRSSYKIPLKNISAVLSDNHNVELVMRNGQSMLCCMTFKEFQNMLADKANFLECNRGIIINMDCVMSLNRDKDVFIMQNGAHYAIHVRRHKNIIESFTQYQITKLRSSKGEF